MMPSAALGALAEGRLPAGTSHGSLPRLRFDRVAQRLVRDLQALLSDALPGDKALILTVTAPIRLPARTVASLAERVRLYLAGGEAEPELDETICGNGVRARIVRRGLLEAPKVIVFVHNPDPPPDGLLDAAEALLA